MASFTDIASEVENCSVAMQEATVLARLGKLSERILEMMQQSEDTKFTETHVALIRNTNTKQKGSAIVKCVTEAEKGVKAGFACALLAVDAQLLAKISSDLHEKVSRSAAKEYIRVGGTRILKDAFKNALKNSLPSCKTTINFVNLGKSGAGKSTLLNALVGQFKPEEKGHATRTTRDQKPAKSSSSADSCTKHVQGQRVSLSEMSGLPIDLVVWDTPGLHDFNPNDKPDAQQQNSKKRTEQCIKELIQKVKKRDNIDLVIFCIDCTNPRYSLENSAIIATLTKYFTKDVWKHCLFVLTKANLLRSAHDDDDAENFRSAISSIEEGCQKLLETHGIESEVIKGIKFIPVGSDRDRVLADGNPWLPEFWVAAVERATDRGSSFLLMFNEDRLRSSEDRIAESQSNKIVLTNVHLARIVRIAPRVTLPDARIFFAIFGGGVGAGAAIGAIAGAPFGGPIGAVIGGGIGAGVGAVGSAIASFITWKKSQ